MKDKLTTTIDELDGCLQSIESKYNAGVIDGFTAQSFPQFLPDDTVPVFFKPNQVSMMYSNPPKLLPIINIETHYKV